MDDVGIKKAQHVKYFCEHLTVTQGDFAGKPFKFLPWQWGDVVLPLFGTLKENGLRQYRYCYLEIPKKSGKTPLAAVLGLYGLFADDEPAPEVYIAAADREQASYCFRYASQMVEQEPTLSKYSKIIYSQKRILNTENNGFLLVLSAEAYTKHGINPSFLIIDELHAHPNDELYYTLTSGTHYARRQQVVFIMSTAGERNTEHIWWKVREKARQIRDGVVKQDNFLPVLYIADENDRYDDEEVWKKTNPSLGYLYSIDKMREEYEEVKNDEVAKSKFKRFRLNMPESNVMRWIPMDDWDKCDKELPELAGKRCFGGLDMSTKVDLSAFVLVFPVQDGIDKPCILCRGYTPEETIRERSKSDRVHYDIWANQGWICATPGNVIDNDFIVDDIVKANSLYEIVELGFDPAHAREVSIRLYNDFFVKMVELPQTWKHLSEPSKSLLAAVKKHDLNHGNNPVLRWCIDNLVMRLAPNENVHPDKSKATDRIDMAVALIMAWGRAIFAEPIYDDPMITVIGGKDEI